MENIVFIIVLAGFILYDSYKIIVGKINFYSFYRPLFIVIVYRYILANVNVVALYVALAYMLIDYLYILRHLNLEGVEE